MSQVGTDNTGCTVPLKGVFSEAGFSRLPSQDTQVYLRVRVKDWKRKTPLGETSAISAKYPIVGVLFLRFKLEKFRMF